MKEIVKNCEVILTEKKSRFITRLLKINSEAHAIGIIQKIREHEKGANHNCFAWRVLKSNKQIYIRRSDDGEPTGTAGAPMLAILVGENLVNVLVVTTRYFGGVKLGTGGLATMYKKGLKAAIEKAGTVQYEVKEEFSISVSIKKADMFINLLEKAEIPIDSKIFGRDLRIDLKVGQSKTSELMQILQQVQGVIV